MGWTAFAGIMMVMGGVMWVFVGIVAILNEDFYVSDLEWFFKLSATTWGWIHVLLGIVVLMAGYSLFSGAVWARTVGVIVAVLWSLVAFSWLPWHPVWAVVFIAISIFVILALTLHGREIADARRTR